MERRVLPAAQLTLRGEGDGLTFTGYAATFNTRSEDLGGFREVIAPGAFSKSLATPARPVRMFHNHNLDVVLASTDSGTLKLSEDTRGLRVEAQLPDSEWGRPVANAIQRGTVTSMSFGFTVDASKDVTWKDQTRTVHNLDLFEVSTVSGWPAYPNTVASVRAASEFRVSMAEALQEALRQLVVDPRALTESQRAMLTKYVDSRLTRRVN